ncbi:MAG: polysaccharide deacetylase family protein [Acidobacteriaceae bacterium]|nr:polysaccharide deacetylase family protein [Acidobacteriaceae bacterium]
MSTITEQTLPHLYLLYHELRLERSSYSYVLEADTFERQMELLARIRQSKGKTLWPEVTFDDGHVSNLEIALPILQKYRMEARFFVTAGWTESKPGYMSWANLRCLLGAGQQIGAHGWSHTLLTHCHEDELRRELDGTRKTLEDRLGVAVDTMSLPGGRYNQRVLTACRDAGYMQIYTSVPRAEALPLREMVGRLNVLQSMGLEWMEGLFAGRNSLAGLERRYRRKDAVKSVLGDRLYEKIWAILNRKEAEAE